MITTDQLQLNLDLQQFFKYYKAIKMPIFWPERIGMNRTLLSPNMCRWNEKTISSRQKGKPSREIHMIGREYGGAPVRVRCSPLSHEGSTIVVLGERKSL